MLTHDAGVLAGQESCHASDWPAHAGDSHVGLDPSGRYLAKVRGLRPRIVAGQAVAGAG
ncbi:MAG: hypothetical protein RIB84_29755 [Sneathiellaceae bacterium]